MVTLDFLTEYFESRRSRRRIGYLEDFENQFSPHCLELISNTWQFNVSTHSRSKFSKNQSHNIQQGVQEKASVLGDQIQHCNEYLNYKQPDVHSRALSIHVILQSHCCIAAEDILCDCCRNFNELHFFLKNSYITQNTCCQSPNSEIFSETATYVQCVLAVL